MGKTLYDGGDPKLLDPPGPPDSGAGAQGRSDLPGEGAQGGNARAVATSDPGRVVSPEPGAPASQRSADQGPDLPEAEPAEPSHAGRPLRILLLLLALVPLLGRFLPGPGAWGFNHLAYLPVWATGVWVVLALLLLLPPTQARIARAFEGTLPRWIYGTWHGPLALIAIAAATFGIFRERSFFMGDGYLVGELVERGIPFRAFDNMDYLLHFEVYKWLHGRIDVSSFTVYRVGSVLAGMIGILLVVWLTRRLSWEPWRKMAVLAFILLTGPVMLFHGYVESYSYLFVALTAFLLAGLAALERRGPLWPASLFFGLGIFSHLTAVFSGPAMLYLALRAPIRPAWKRWLEAVLPAAFVVMISIVLHLAAGYNERWFHKEFIENQNTKSLWVPLLGDHGLLSLHFWRDLFNLALITSPVALAIVLLRGRFLLRHREDRRVQFLLAQVLSIAFFSLAIDRKLGGARDWDLLAAHSAGLALLAVLVIGGLAPSIPLSAREPSGVRRARSRRDARGRGRGRRGSRRDLGRAAVRETRGDPGGGPPANPPPTALSGSPDSLRLVALAVVVCFLLSAPWIFLENQEPRSIARFVDVASGFPRFPRAYAYEEVGKYYRKAGDYRRALALYRRCVDSFSTNPRFHVLLGSAYLLVSNEEGLPPDSVLAYRRKAEEGYREALRLDDDNILALESLGRMDLAKPDFAEAAKLYGKIVQIKPGSYEAWEALGVSDLRINRPEEALPALQQAFRLQPSLKLGHQIGAALLALGRYQEAADAFRSVLARGGTTSESRYGLAASLTSMARDQVARGHPADPGLLDEAEEQIGVLLAANPDDADALDLRQRIELLRKGVIPRSEGPSASSAGDAPGVQP
jgi:tetratricopeptide (TPR) repeat protein